CCECGASLSHWYYEKDGRLFCKKDYWAKFGELCHGCSEPITTGLIMTHIFIRGLNAADSEDPSADGGQVCRLCVSSYEEEEEDSGQQYKLQ
ncbi:LIM domain kinase 1, partial [Anabarilius grahami]